MAVDPNNKVTVTARDIEFDNFTSNTGKWNSATMTLMVLDNETEGMQEYDEKLVAVFKKHGTSETVSFSAVVDGVDTRITTTDALDPSAKYELDGIYGEDTEQEYTTTSKFYFQVPGKKWDFANDTVSGDVNLVSGWHNYGYMTDTSDVAHGMTSMDEVKSVLSGYSNSQGGKVLINGVEYPVNNVKGVKTTSMATGDARVYSGSSPRNAYEFNSLEDLDIVSSKITYIPDGFLAGYSTKFNKRFALPETLLRLHIFRGSPKFNQNLWIPDSVKNVVGESFRMADGFVDKKIRFPDGGDEGVEIGNEVFYMASKANPEVVMPNLLKSLGYNFIGFTKFQRDITFPDGLSKVPNTFAANWTCPSADRYTQDDKITITFNEGVTEFGDGCVCNVTNLKEVIMPSTLRKIGNNCFRSIPYDSGYNYPGQRLRLIFPDSVEEVGNNFLEWSFKSYNNADFGKITAHFPDGIKKIGSNFMQTSSAQIFYDSERYDFSGWGFNYTDKTLYVPEGVTEIGSYFMTSVSGIDKFKIVLPSTMQTIGSGFYSNIYVSDMNREKDCFVDLSKISPDIWPDNDTSSFTSASYMYLPVFNITVAPGTVDAWKAKLPDIQWDGRTQMKRKIKWVEKPVTYGVVYYKPSANEAEKSVEIQSLADFNSLTFTSFRQTRTIADGDGTVTLKNSEYPNQITGFTIGTDISSIPDNFGYWCKVHTFDFQDSNTTVTIGNSCCSSNQVDSSYTMKIDLKNRVTTIGNHFFSTHYYVEEVNGFGSVTSVGSSFVSSGKLNTYIDDMSNLETIGDYFLAYSSFFNRPLDLSSLTKVPNYFLSDCTMFNQPIDLSNITDKQNLACTQFLNNCTSFNSTITFASNLTGSFSGKSLISFLSGCSSYNQPIDLSFAQGANQFEIMDSCTSFNSQILLPTSVRMGHFLNNATSFNQPIVLPSLTETTGIYSRLCFNWESFNQDVTIPTSWCNTGWYNNATLFENCRSMTSTVTFSSTTVPGSDYPKALSHSFSTLSETDDSYVQGVKFTGTGASAWKTALADSTSSPYRKIIVV